MAFEAFVRPLFRSNYTVINKADETGYIRCIDNFARFLWDSNKYYAKHRHGEGSVYPWQKLIDSTKDFLQMVEKEKAEAEQAEKQVIPQRLFNGFKRKLSDLSLPGRKKSPSPQLEMTESTRKQSSPDRAGKKPAERNNDSHHKNQDSHRHKQAKQPSLDRKSRAEEKAHALRQEARFPS